MGPQNLNNYYFNKLDARLDYSSYYDFFLAADEKDYNKEVIYSPYIICVWDHLDDYLSGITFSSNCLGFWIDLNDTNSTWQPNLSCNQYYDNNTLLSLSYWENHTPTISNAKCSCPKCENSVYTANTNFVESICDVGLTGIDNSLVKYMSGNTTEYDWCLREFISLTAITGTVTGTTTPTSGICYFSGATWSPTTPTEVSTETAFQFLYPCNVSGLTSTGTSITNNFEIIKNNLQYSGCCVFTGSSAYTVTLSKAKIIQSGSSVNLGIFTAHTTTNVGYLKVPCQVESLKLWVEMPDQYKYDHLHYDRRFKMKQITGYTQHRTNYSIVSVTGGTEGYYQQLYGGFYQGFYQLDGYPYKVLPNRPECGWTVETLLKIRTGDTACDTHFITCGVSMSIASPSGVVLVNYPNHGQEVGNIVTVTNSLNSDFNTDLYPEDFAVITEIVNDNQFRYNSGRVVIPSGTTTGCVLFYEKKTFTDILLEQNPLGTVTASLSVPYGASSFSLQQPVDFGFNLTSNLDDHGNPWNLDYDDITTIVPSGFTYSTTEFILGATGTTDITLYYPVLHNTLNDIYPNNAGFFYYLGTRAENKFHNYYSAETYLQTCDQKDYSCEGPSVPLITSATTYVGCPPQPKTIKSTYDSKLDVLSNSFGLRLTPWNNEAQTGYTVGYRAIYYTGDCITTYSHKKIIDCDNNVTYTKDECVTGLTYSSGFTVVEKYSPTICGLSGATYRAEEPWVLISARFRRNFCYEGCDILNRGGFNDLVYIPVTDTVGYIDSGIGNATSSLVREAPLMPGFNDQGNKVGVTGQYTGEGIPTGLCVSAGCPPPSGCTSDYTKLTEKIRFSKLWSDEIGYRKGTLTIFVNGRPVLVDDDFEEIIPRRLNTEPQKQVAVPYNISWGGGSQGLYENLTFTSSGTTIEICPPYQQDPTDLGLLIERYFAGTYDGGISQIRQYIKPLGNDEIFHNFLVNKFRYDLIDCIKDCTVCDPCPVLYVLECESLDLILNYTTPNMDEVAVNELNQYVTTPPYVGVKFISTVSENVSSYVITKYPDNGLGVPEIVTTPFNALPDDVIYVKIIKINTNKNSKVTLIGNLYR